MVTSEDRKEVVKVLHDLCDGCETVSDYDLAKALCLVAASRYAYSSDSVLRIADLIEPEQERTCENESSVSGIFTCSYCGADFYDTEISGDWNYCPNCGARVVEE